MKNNLTSKDIANKQFDASFKGYDALAVDSYLDLIIEDYVYFEDIIEKLQTANRTLSDKVNSLGAPENSQDSESKKYINEINRLNNRVNSLEKTLSNLGIDPNKIK